MATPLSYSSFDDPHLQTYFGNKNVRKHLRKVGLMNRYGDIIPDREYQSSINERSRREHVRALLSNGIVQRVIQLEKHRQANMRNEMEIEAKKQLVENVKESRQHYKEYRSKDLIKLNRPKSRTSNNHQTQQQIKIIDEYKLSPSRLSSINPSRSSQRLIRNKSPKIIKQNENISSKDHCQITMIYLGGQINHDSNSNSSEIVVMQQHCGGQNLILFKNSLKPNEKFQFESRRHSEYPFALTLYIDGLIDCRISVCCEYKHKLGLPLGGKRASFAFLNVQGGKPCRTCRFNEYISSSKTKSSDENTIITETSKSRTSDQSNSHRLLRTPSPFDGEEEEEEEEYQTTIVSNQIDAYNEAEEIYQNLLKKLNEKINCKENGYLHCQLGNLSKEGLGHYEKALDHYLISLEILCQYLSPLDIKLRNIYLSIGHILLLQGKKQNKVAIEYFERVLLIDNSLNNINENNLINDHNYLGLLYQNENNYSKALFHFDKSLQYFLSLKQNKKINQNDYLFNQTIYDKKAFLSLSIDKLPDLSEIHYNLATTYQNLGQKQNALKHAQKALQLSNQDQKKFHFFKNYFYQLQQN